jgi:hypothetical protein
LSSTNTVAYLASSSETKKKSFITLTPGWLCLPGGLYKDPTAWL